MTSNRSTSISSGPSSPIDGRPRRAPVLPNTTTNATTGTNTSMNPGSGSQGPHLHVQNPPDYQTPYTLVPPSPANVTNVSAGQVDVSSTACNEANEELLDHLEFTLEDVRKVKNKQQDLYGDVWILRDTFAKDGTPNAALFDALDENRFQKSSDLGKDMDNLVSFIKDICDYLQEGQGIAKQVADDMSAKIKELQVRLDNMIIAATKLRVQFEGIGWRYDAKVEYKVIGNQTFATKSTKTQKKRTLSAIVPEEASMVDVDESLNVEAPSEPPKKKRPTRATKSGKKVLTPKVNAPTFKVSTPKASRKRTRSSKVSTAPVSANDSPGPAASAQAVDSDAIGPKEQIEHCKFVISAQADIITQLQQDIKEFKHEKENKERELQHLKGQLI